MQIQPANLEGTGEVPLRWLVQETLRICLPPSWARSGTRRTRLGESAWQPLGSVSGETVCSARSLAAGELGLAGVVGEVAPAVSSLSGARSPVHCSRQASVIDVASREPEPRVLGSCACVLLRSWHSSTMIV